YRSWMAGGLGPGGASQAPRRVGHGDAGASPADANQRMRGTGFAAARRNLLPRAYRAAVPPGPFTAAPGPRRSGKIPIPPLPAGFQPMYPKDSRIEGYDAELARASAAEGRRQEDHVELIAPETYASPRVLEAQGSKLTNKYAEGYPGKRYYAGCEYVDVAEALALERVKQLFDCDYANVQPHSGSQANQAVYFALLSPGDTILGMSLAHGGHLTHGAKVNLSGKIFNAVQYGVDGNGLIDYDEVQRLALDARPKMVV